MYVPIPGIQKQQPDETRQVTCSLKRVLGLFLGFEQPDYCICYPSGWWVILGPRIEPLCKEASWGWAFEEKVCITQPVLELIGKSILSLLSRFGGWRLHSGVWWSWSHLHITLWKHWFKLPQPRLSSLPITARAESHPSQEQGTQSLSPSKWVVRTQLFEPA